MLTRCIAVFVVLLAPIRVSAVKEEKFEMGKHVWTVVHQAGGLTVTAVARHTSAIDVSVFGFFGRKTIDGSLRLHGVDWHVMFGKEVITDHYNRWVVASYPDGTVRICSSPEAAYRYGRPSFGAAGMKIPPEPNARLKRQFWATKGHLYFRVTMFGNRWDCQRYASRRGFEAMVHTDASSSLVPGVRHPSIAKVYLIEDYQALLATH